LHGRDTLSKTKKQTLNESDILKIIKEEYKRAKRRTSVREQELGSLSSIEIEELLANYFYRHGGKIPPNINKLSVLFPILQNAGLKNVVSAYNNTAKTFGKEAASHILRDVSFAINKISHSDFDQDAFLQKQDESYYKLLNNLAVGDRLNIPFTSGKLARDEMGTLDETGSRFVWSVEEIINNESDLFESELSLRHEATGASAKMSFSELIDYHAYKSE
jgi:hypothetical protein